MGITQNFKEGLDDMQKKIKPITIPVSVGDTPKEPTGNKPVTTQNPAVTPRGKSDAGKAAEQQAKQIEAAYKKNLEATRKLQDAQLQLETDEWAKRRQQTQYQYSRQIEDLQHQLQTEKDLNETGRQAINATITALEQQQTEALLKIEQDRQLQELALQKESIELRLQAVKKGSEQERQLRMQLLENERQTALSRYPPNTPITALPTAPTASARGAIAFQSANPPETMLFVAVAKAEVLNSRSAYSRGRSFSATAIVSLPKIRVASAAMVPKRPAALISLGWMPPT